MSTSTRFTLAKNYEAFISIEPSLEAHRWFVSVQFDYVTKEARRLERFVSGSRTSKGRQRGH